MDDAQITQALEAALVTGDVDRINALGVIVADGGDLERAARWFRVAASFGDALAFDHLGAALMGLDDYEAAQAAYESAIELGYPAARVGLAIALTSDVGDVPRVEDLLTAAADDDEPDALHQLGLLRWRQDRLDEAIALLDHAVDREPSGTVVDSLARVHRAAGDLEESLRLFQRAGDAGYSEALLSRAFTLEEAGRHAEAEESFLAAIARKVPIAEASYASALGRVGRQDEAMTVLRAAAARDDFSAMMDLANLLTASPETFDEGLGIHRRAISLGDRDAMTNLAVSFLDRDPRDERAAAMMRQAAAEGDEVAESNRDLDDLDDDGD